MMDFQYENHEMTDHSTCQVSYNSQDPLVFQLSKSYTVIFILILLYLLLYYRLLMSSSGRIDIVELSSNMVEYQQQQVIQQRGLNFDFSKFKKTKYPVTTRTISLLVHHTTRTIPVYYRSTKVLVLLQCRLLTGHCNHYYEQIVYNCQHFMSHYYRHLIYMLCAYICWAEQIASQLNLQTYVPSFL